MEKARADKPEIACDYIVLKNLVVSNERPYEKERILKRYEAECGRDHIHERIKRLIIFYGLKAAEVSCHKLRNLFEDSPNNQCRHSDVGREDLDDFLKRYDEEDCYHAEEKSFQKKFPWFGVP